MTASHLDLFHESYCRVLTTGDFFGDFYDAYVGSSEEVAGKFKRTDVVARAEMLTQSLTYMVAYCTNRVASPALQRAAASHSKVGRNIEPPLYDAWLTALLATVRLHDTKWDGDVELAWRRMLAPSIAYMKSCYEPSVQPIPGSFRLRGRSPMSVRRKVLFGLGLCIAWLLVLVLSA